MNYRIVAAPSAKDNLQRVVRTVVRKLKNNDFGMHKTRFDQKIEALNSLDGDIPTRVTA